MKTQQHSLTMLCLSEQHQKYVLKVIEVDMLEYEAKLSSSKTIQKNARLKYKWPVLFSIIF